MLISENRRLHERAFFAAGDDSTFAARDDLRAFSLADFDAVQNLFELTALNYMCLLDKEFFEQNFKSQNLTDFGCHRNIKFRIAAQLFYDGCM